MHDDLTIVVLRQFPGPRWKVGGKQIGRKAETDRRAGDVTAAERVRGRLRYQLTVAHHPDPVGQVLHLVEIMRGKQHCGARVPQAGDHVPGIPPCVRVEASRGLVEEQQLRIADEGEGKVKPAQLPAGQRPDPGTALAPQAHLLDRYRRIPRTGVETGVKCDHLPHRQLGVVAARLQHDPDALAEAAPACTRIESEHPHRTGGALAVTLENLHGRGLASAVGPEKCIDLTAPDLEAHAVDRTQPTVILAQPLCNDGGRLTYRHTFHKTDNRQCPTQVTAT
jgi:hypothetical protein